MRIPIIPTHYNGLPNSTIIFSNDILEFFGYIHKHGAGNVDSYMKEGYLPAPCETKLKQIGRVKNRNKHWLLGDLRKLRKDMLDEIS